MAGDNFSQKIEDILKEYLHSKSLFDEYKIWNKSNKESEAMVNHNIIFINSDLWPRESNLANTIELRKNEQINLIINNYTKFHHFKCDSITDKQKKNKVIDWIFTVSTFELEAKLNNCVYTFHTSPLIAMILLLYTEKNRCLDFSYICNKFLCSVRTIELALDDLVTLIQ